MLMVLYGTKEARELVAILKARGYEVMAAVVTEYGKTVLSSECEVEVFMPQDPLNLESELSGSIIGNGIRLIVDATHPWPGPLSVIARRVAREQGVRYIRYTRRETSLPDNGSVYRVDSWEEAAHMAGSQDKTIFLTTGSNNLEVFLRSPATRGKRIVVRVLPEYQIIKKCQDQGLAPRDIVALQGPFSVKLNRAIFKAYRTGVVVTRDGGSSDTEAKLKAAASLNIPVIMIRRDRSCNGEEYTATTPGEVLAAVDKFLQGVE